MPRFTSAAAPARIRRRGSSPGTLQTRPLRRRHARAHTNRALSPELIGHRRDAAWLVVTVALLLALGVAGLLFFA